MSIASERERIRASREVVVVSRNPWTFEVTSTDGSYQHRIWWSAALKDCVCETCFARHLQGGCWARKRCVAWLRAEMEQRRAASAG